LQFLILLIKCQQCFTKPLISITGHGVFVPLLKFEWVG
jgi:hypothetical protein